MNKTLKEKWVVALRSGEYEQGKGYLRVGGTYCCLGVLCEIGVKEGVIQRGGGERSRYYYDAENFSSSMSLTTTMREWAGLTKEEDPEVDSVNQLIRMNDNGDSFTEIADWIEREL